MNETAEVLYLDDYRERETASPAQTAVVTNTGASTRGDVTLPPEPIYPLAPYDSGLPDAYPDASADRVPTDRLYPFSSEFQTAQRLLGEAIKLCDGALLTYRQLNLLEADDLMQRVHLLLPELFCCRALSDGLGAVINAIFHSLQNLNGTQLAEQQIAVIAYSLKRLQKEPFLAFNMVMDLIDDMEKNELQIDPQGLSDTVDILDG